jgi:hypothetical protein
MPPHLATAFTQGEAAVLKVVADAVKHGGVCVMPMDEIAGRAGVCRRLAQTAIRLAEAGGLLQVTERRLSATRNDTNVITIIDSSWRAWLRLEGGGCKKAPTTPHRISKRPATVSGYRRDGSRLKPSLRVAGATRMPR